MRTLFALLLLAAMRVATADNVFDYVFTIAPNPAPPGSDITVTIAAPDNHCVPLDEELIWSLQGDTVHISIPDSDGCESVPADTRVYHLGALPAGVYTFSFSACGGIDDEGNTICQILEEFVVSVQASSGSARKIPALSLPALVGMSLVMMLVAAGWRRD